MDEELEVRAGPRRKGVLWPLLGAVCFLLPGGVTYMFALGEARAFASDWVYISAPLLVLGGLCLLLVLGRLLGRAGWALGALVVLGGLGGAGIALSAEIDRRVAWDAGHRALRDAERLCNGTGKPDPRAAAYDPKRPGKHPTVFVADFDHGHDYSAEHAAFERFEPERFQIDEVELLVCLRDKRDTVESCPYSEGAVKKRVRVDREIRLLVVRTGEELFKTTLVGQAPRACQATEKFYGREAKEGAIFGEPPSLRDLMAQIEPFLVTR
jgi:hypothetical protein